jgi:WD40 repeat protein
VALAVTGEDRKITVYRLPKFEEVSSIRMAGNALEAAVSGDLRTLAVAFQDGGVHRVSLWDLAANTQRGVVGEYRRTINCLQFSPDSNVLLAACDDGEIGLWSVVDGRPLASPARDSSSPDEDWQIPPFFGPGSTRLYLNRGRERRVLEVWDWSTSKLRPLYQAHLGRLQAFAFSADGVLLAVADADGSIALLNMRDSLPIGSMPANRAVIISLAFSPSGSLLASGSEDRTAKLWDVKTQRELATLGGNDNKVTQVAFTPDEKSLITLSGDGKIKIWNINAIQKRGVLWRTTNSFEGFKISPDERAIATRDGAGQMIVWDRVTGAKVRTIQTGEPTGFAIAFSPTQHVVAWGGWNSVGILDYDSGQSNAFSLSRYGFCSPAFSPNGREIAFGGPTNIVILDGATRKLRPFAEVQSTVFSLAFSANGSLLASAHRGGTLTLWNWASGQEIAKVVGQPPDAYNVQFSPDARTLASAGSDGTGKLWDIAQGRLSLRYTLRGHVGIANLVFSPDGQRVVSKSKDNTLKLWDTQTGLEVGTFYGHRGSVAGIAFSSDGDRIYSAAEDGDVRIWQAPPLEEEDLLSLKGFRGLGHLDGKR